MTAIVSTAPWIEADEREVAHAVAVAFGLFGMLVYPYFSHAVLGRSETVGLFLDGRTRHLAGCRRRVDLPADLRRRCGAASCWVTKPTRNPFLAAVIPLLTWMHVRSTHKAGAVRRNRAGRRTCARVRPRVPGDGRAPHDRRCRRPLVGCGVRAAGRGRLGLHHQPIGDYWASRVFLGTAMAAAGPNTGFGVFRGVGAKPFLVGLAGALAVALSGLVMALLLGPYVSL